MSIHLPPFPEVSWYCPILNLGEGTKRTVPGQGMREDDSQLNEPSSRGRGQRDACRPRPLDLNYISHGASGFLSRCTPGVQDSDRLSISEFVVLSQKGPESYKLI